MKVILAGMPKTGTKSMVVAFKELGMNVYDYMENYEYLGKDWEKICTEGGTVEDFRRMFKGVDAVTDMPCFYFWEELLEAFPDAKVILTMRDNEDIWFKSFIKQFNTFNNPLIFLIRLFSPSGRRFFSYAVSIGVPIFRQPERSMFDFSPLNEQQYKKIYRIHNSHVIHSCPEDKLLIYNVKDGWEPLCKFLGVKVPSKPFPHKNVRGNITDELMASHPVMLRMKRELTLSLSLLAILISFGCYKAAKGSSLTPSFCNSLSDMFTPFMTKLMFWK